MGGNLAVTIREQDGTEHRMDRWTNPTPYFVNNPRLCDKDPKYIKDYLKQWYDFLADWKQAKGRSNRCKLPMTPCYAGHPYLAPSEYGQLVIDLKTDHILHMQGYTSYGTVDTIGLSLELRQLRQDREAKAGKRHCVTINVGAGEDDSKLASLLEFGKRGKILGLVTYGRDGKRRVALRNPTAKKAIEFIERDREMRHFGYVAYDMSPFKVERFEEDHEGAMAMLKRVRELGFKLSKKEERIWAKWRNNDEE